MTTDTRASDASLPAIAAALRKTTELLAAELAAPTETTPDWTDFEWRIAQSAAAMHGISPLLSASLRWRGPDSWRRFIDEQRDHTCRRHQRIVRLMDEIGTQAASEGVAMLALKGVALHDIGLYRPGERPMSDIDLLVRSEDEQAGAQVLAACGYHGSYVGWKHWIFEPDAGSETIGFGEHAGNPIKIELHSKITERLPAVDRDITAVIFPPRPVAGLNAYPSNAALMIHLLFHAAGNLCVNIMRLLHLNDIALLARRMTDSDWDQVFADTSDGKPWWASPPLMLTARYYPSAIPSHVVARAEANCPLLIRGASRRRTLSDVSLSNLWIQAFPGIEWSQSVQEAFAYAKSRVFLDREMRTLRKELPRISPRMAADPWSKLSQWQRVVRWASARRPRVQTLSSVRGALGSELTSRS